MTDVVPQIISAAADALVNKRCWQVLAGAIDFTFSLHFGSRLRLSLPPTATKRGRRGLLYEGECVLLVWCPWRLDGPKGPVCSSDCDKATIVQGLDSLVRRRVSSVQTTPPAWDMSIQFTGAFGLRVFAEYVPPTPTFDGNWQIATPDLEVYAGPGYAWGHEPRLHVHDHRRRHRGPGSKRLKA